MWRTRRRRRDRLEADDGTSCSLRRFLLESGKESSCEGEKPAKLSLMA